MADKQEDQPLQKRVRDSLIDKDGVHASKIFGQELKKETIDKLKTSKSWANGALSLMVFAFMGSQLGELGYMFQDHDRPLDETFASTQMIKDGEKSYSAFSVSGQDYLLTRDENGGYALYFKDSSEAEYDLITNASTALGHLHGINTHLQKAQTDLEAGNLPNSSSVSFQDLLGLSVLHEEERNTLERHFNSANNTGENYRDRLENLTQHVQTSAQQIFDENLYAGRQIGANENIEKFDSDRDYASAGLQNGFYLWLALLLGSPLVASGKNTRRRLRDKSNTPK